MMKKNSKQRATCRLSLFMVLLLGAVSSNILAAALAIESDDSVGVYGYRDDEMVLSNSDDGIFDDADENDDAFDYYADNEDDGEQVEDDEGVLLL